MPDLKCSEIRDVFRSGRVPSDGELAAHVKDCDQCQDLLADGGRLGLSLGGLPRPVTPELVALRDAVLQNARREVGPRAWLRSRSRRQRLSLSLGVALVLAGLVATRGARPDLHSATPLLVWGPTSVYLGGLLLGIRELVADPARAIHARRRFWLAMGISILPATAVLWAPAHLVHEVGAPFGKFSMHAAGCFLFASLFTTSLLGCLWLLDRGDRLSRSAALLAAATAGVFGNLTAHLHCAFSEPVHLLLGHAAVLPIWAIIYVTLAARRRPLSRNRDRVR